MYLGIYTREEKMCPQGAVFLQYSLESVVSSERLLEKRSFSTASKLRFNRSFFSLFRQYALQCCLWYHTDTGYSEPPQAPDSPAYTICPCHVVLFSAAATLPNHSCTERAYNLHCNDAQNPGIRAVRCPSARKAPLALTVCKQLHDRLPIFRRKCNFFGRERIVINRFARHRRIAVRLPRKRIIDCTADLPWCKEYAIDPNRTKQKEQRRCHCTFDRFLHIVSLSILYPYSCTLIIPNDPLIVNQIVP